MPIEKSLIHFQAISIISEREVAFCGIVTPKHEAFSQFSRPLPQKILADEQLCPRSLNGYEIVQTP